MKLELKEKSKKKKRLGRGISSGSGKTSGKGTKGQKSRTGNSIPRGFEGGQNPLKHRIPKTRGFKNINLKEVFVVNLSRLNVFKDGEEVSPKTLFEKKIIRKISQVKILSDGELKSKVKIVGVKVSQSAQGKIKKAGGEIVNA